MWFVFDNIEHRNDLQGQSGKKYSGYVVTGTKRGYDGAPDVPYQKILFENQSCTVIERGIPRPGVSIVQFFQKGVKPGDLLVIKNERDGRFWKWDTITKRDESIPTYEPLTEEEIQNYSKSGSSTQPAAAPAAKLPSFLSDNSSVPF